MDPMVTVLLLVAVLAALIVGLAIPVLIQLRGTLADARRWLNQMGPKLDATLDEARQTTTHLNSMTSELEESTKRAKALLEAAGEMGKTVRRMNRSLRLAATVGSAVGPAVAAGVKAFMDGRATAGNPGPTGDSPAPESATETPRESQDHEGEQA